MLFWLAGCLVYWLVGIWFVGFLVDRLIPTLNKQPLLGDRQLSSIFGVVEVKISTYRKKYKMLDMFQHVARI
jgi:hypothetical protein